jgi:hypothetical protein
VTAKEYESSTLQTNRLLDEDASSVTDTEANEMEEPPSRPRLSRLGTSDPGARLAFQMDAAVWTAIAVLAATSLGTLFYLGARIDSLAARVDARFDALIGRMDSRFDAIEARFDALAARFDAHFDRHAAR